MRTLTSTEILTSNWDCRGFAPHVMPQRPSRRPAAARPGGGLTMTTARRAVACGSLARLSGSTPGVDQVIDLVGRPRQVCGPVAERTRDQPGRGPEDAAQVHRPRARSRAAPRSAAAAPTVERHGWSPGRGLPGGPGGEPTSRAMTVMGRPGSTGRGRVMTQFVCRRTGQAYEVGEQLDQDGEGSSTPSYPGDRTSLSSSTYRQPCRDDRTSRRESRR